MKSYTCAWSVLALFIIFFVCMSGCTETGGTGQPVNTTVPVEDAWGQAVVAILETETLFESGDEISDELNNSVVLKEPAGVLCDPDGKPLDYLFSVMKNGETVSIVRVSADKSLGRTIAGIGDPVFSCGSEILNLSGELTGSKTEYFACGTPVPEYSEDYGKMMFDAWEIGNQYSKNVLNDLKDAGIDISEPVPADEHGTVREIIYDNIVKKEDSIEEFESKYQVDWVF